MRVCVAMLTMNEAGAAEEVIADVRRTVPEAEIVVVDSSDDATPRIAEAMGARVLRQYPSRGYNAAMALLLREARGDIVVTLDCDTTYPVCRIPDLIRAIAEEGYDVADGSRLPPRPKAMPLANYLGNVLLARIASAIYGRRIPDLHSGMRAYRKSMLDRVRLDVRGDALAVDLLLVPLRMGARIKHLPIDYRPRVGRSKMRPLPTILWTLRRIAATRFA